MVNSIKIIKDPKGTYQPNDIVKADDLIGAYCDSGASEALQEWLWAIPREDAIGFIAGAWGIQYEVTHNS